MQSTLPNELLLDIFQFFSRNDIELAQIVSKKWRSILSNKSLSSLRVLKTLNIGASSENFYLRVLDYYSTKKDNEQAYILIDSSDNTVDRQRLESLRNCIFEGNHTDGTEFELFLKALDQAVSIIGEKIRVIKYFCYIEDYVRMPRLFEYVTASCVSNPIHSLDQFFDKSVILPDQPKKLYIRTWLSEFGRDMDEYEFFSDVEEISRRYIELLKLPLTDANRFTFRMSNFDEKLCPELINIYTTNENPKLLPKTLLLNRYHKIASHFMKLVDERNSKPTRVRQEGKNYAKYAYDLRTKMGLTLKIVIEIDELIEEQNLKRIKSIKLKIIS